MPLIRFKTARRYDVEAIRETVKAHLPKGATEVRPGDPVELGETGKSLGPPGGAGFTFAGWGASWTVTLKASGTEAHTAQLADTDATQLEQATVATVSVNWSCEHALRIEKTSSTGNKPAEGSASASAESKATITFTTTAPQ